VSVSVEAESLGGVGDGFGRVAQLFVGVGKLDLKDKTDGGGEELDGQAGVEGGDGGQEGVEQPVDHRAKPQRQQNGRRGGRGLQAAVAEGDDAGGHQSPPDQSGDAGVTGGRLRPRLLVQLRPE